jgi:hypothetical protein
VILVPDASMTEFQRLPSHAIASEAKQSNFSGATAMPAKADHLLK